MSTAIKGLALAASALERLHSLKYRAMGLDRHVDERELPKLIIDCYTDDELADIRAQQGDEKDMVGAELVDDAPSGADLGPAPRSRPEDDDVVALGFDADKVGEERTQAAMTVVPIDEEGCRLARDAR